MIGKQILHYKILEKLGEGVMGIVYLAEDTKLDRNKAINLNADLYLFNSRDLINFCGLNLI
jgi:hypothetical protein